MTVLITFPDGKERPFSKGITGYDIAGALALSLQKKAIALKIDGVLSDLSDPIEHSCSVQMITRDDPEALDLIRHDCAHVLAQAVQELFPGTQVTIGPVIENGFYYDFFRETPFTPEDFPRIEARMREIIAKNHRFTKKVLERDEAQRLFSEKGEQFKVELISSIPQGDLIKIYDQGGWFDLCRGPHMFSTGQVGTAFKLMKVAGAYWRGNKDNPVLTRIYGTAWRTEIDLKAHLVALEEAEKRDHRKLGKEMDLFHFQEEGPGVVFWHHKGWAIFQELVAYMRRRMKKHGYREVNGPQILDRALWETSGHWEWYRENMFVTQTEDERIFAIKPMNCPGHVEIFKHALRSYRELPLRLCEFGVVSRYEPSGALHGLLRVRAFTQDDAHIFCTQEQLEEECLKINTLILSTYADFGFHEILVKLSTRPEKRVGDDQLWDHAEKVMTGVLEKIAAQSEGRVKTGINPGEGAFYGPKFEYVLKDAIGRTWQCGTIQVDFNLPQRFGATYIDPSSHKQYPVMIHQAVCGSMERFLGILLENYSGALPLWLAPVQVMILTIVSDAEPYALDILSKLQHLGIRVEVDLRNEKVNYKIREHSLAKVPILLVLGRKESEEGTVSVRRFGSPEQHIQSLDSFVETLLRSAAPPDQLFGIK